MRRLWAVVVLAVGVLGFAFGGIEMRSGHASEPRSLDGTRAPLAQVAGGGALVLREKRESELDLEVAGDLRGGSAGAVRFLRREDLKELPQVTYTVADDPNFSRAVRVRGVELETLARELATEGEKALVVAVCGDLYRGHYPPAYVRAHRPVLVLEINGREPVGSGKESAGLEDKLVGWPKSPSGSAMGPYLISHPRFTPGFKILGNDEEAQIPWGVVRLEFRNEQEAFGDIAPRGEKAGDAEVQDGYRIAKQNCLRCHGPKSYGRLKGQLSWAGIAFFVDASPRDFEAYVRNPQRVTPSAQMPGNPEYSDATVGALIAYFRSFLTKAKS